MAESLLVVGASARAAVFSAHRAGFKAMAVDLFGDVDLRRLAPCVVARPYPHAIPDAARRLPAAPVMYTGALENHPEILDQLQQDRILLGNPPDRLRQVRDPSQLSDAMESIGHPMPALSLSSTGLPTDGSWLQKRIRGSGGEHARPWRGGKPAEKEGLYYQKLADGLPCSALFVAAGGRARLLGETRQLIGVSWTGASAFRYAGSVGPLSMNPSRKRAWKSIGGRVAEQFELVGLFGVDALWSPQGLVPLEVNPRYTASVEVLERALNFQAVGLHVDACRLQQLPAPARAGSVDGAVYGKAILFARRLVKIGPRFADMAGREAQKTWPDLADIPDAGTTIEPAAPVATVLAQGSDVQSVEAALRVRCAKVEQTLYDDAE